MTATDNQQKYLYITRGRKLYDRCLGCGSGKLRTSDTLHVSLVLFTWTHCRGNPGLADEVRCAQVQPGVGR